MAFKIEISNIFVKLQNHLKIDIQALIGPYNITCKFELNRTSSFRVVDI